MKTKTSLRPSFNLQRRALLIVGTTATLLSGWGRHAEAAAKSDFAEHVMLAKPWVPSLNVADYLVSEKLDGVRALWDGSHLRFRSGRPIAAPAWFLAGLPAMPLDGELWMGRHSFDALSGTVRKEIPVDAEWRSVRYMVFDSPDAISPFAQRASRLTDLLASTGPSWLQAVAQRSVSGPAGLQARLTETIAAGGEGLVLHRADALWTPGRSDALRKLKAEPDEEGRVLGYMAGSGKYRGRMGALLLETPEGRRFSLGTGFSDAMRAHPPEIGAIVTYRYRDRTLSGLPKFASYLRMREAE